MMVSPSRFDLSLGVHWPLAWAEVSVPGFDPSGKVPTSRRLDFRYESVDTA